MENLRFLEMPTLKSPNVAVGFSGWANAGEVSSGAISYLISKLRAVKYAELEPDPFYDFTKTRPIGTISGGVEQGFEFITSEFFYWQTPEGEHDLVLFLGSEPHLRWKEYTECFFAAIDRFEPARLYVLGSFYDSTPHTRPSVVSAAVGDVEDKAKLEEHALLFTDYKGPTSIHSMLQHACRERGIPSLGLWTGTPHYLPTANPKAWEAMLTRLLPMLEIKLDLSDLKRRGEQLDRQVNQALVQNPKLHQYVRQLEEAIEAQEDQEPLRSDEIIKSLEDFLRKKQQEES
ncbi:MAG: PAC2 family protein [Dehalococcoidia bacterium]